MSSRRLPPCREAFTLVEVLVVVVILSVFLGGAYTLFFGGQRVAGKAAWLQYTATDLRQAELVITKAIQTTSYPSTLLPSKMVDAGGTTTTPGPRSAAFYVRLPLGFGRKTAAEVISAPNGILMAMARCSPEKQGFGAEDRVGSLTWMLFRMVPCPEKAGQGTLIYEERPTTYRTTPPDYAANLTSDPLTAPVGLRMELVRNLEFVTISGVASHTPNQITITLTAVYPKDPQVIREGTSAAVPNVGVGTP
jgi:prepilin-type N-terminal cleavage/methylation domain-containing protein